MNTPALHWRSTGRFEDSRSTKFSKSAGTTGRGPSVADRPKLTLPTNKQLDVKSQAPGSSTVHRDPKRSPSARSAGQPTLSEIRKRIADHSGVKHAGYSAAKPSNAINLPGRKSVGEARGTRESGNRIGAGSKGGPSMKVVDLNRAGPGNAKATLERSTRRRFSERSESGDLNRLTQGDIGRKVKLREQYEMHKKGDVARRLGLDRNKPGAHHAGNRAGAAHARSESSHRWHVDHRYRGLVSPSYVHGSFGFHYYGPLHYPRYCWYPRWTHWVDWSWHYDCDPFWDPRPVWCRPVVYVAAPSWVWWEVPVWRPLPVVTSGTWVDVAPVVVGAELDLELLAIRFVDPGHPEEHLGPRYRVWFRNNSTEAINKPFDVVLLASKDKKLADDSPHAGLRVTSIEAGGVQSIDIRLPVEVYSMGNDAQGEPAPFGTLHVLVDANREIVETSEVNNGATLPPEEVLPVDPAAFELEPSTAPAGGEVVLAGEGFGPEPGKVLLHLGGIEMEAEILGWYDLGVRLALPALPLAGPTEAELIVIRGDGAAANPLEITIAAPLRNPEPIPAPPVTP